MNRREFSMFSAFGLTALALSEKAVGGMSEPGGGQTTTGGSVEAKRGSGARKWTLWYAQPAARWLEALPVGNGRLGAMVFGGIERERLALNESTVWSGAPSNRHDNPEAKAHLDEIRQLFFNGKYIEARDLCAKYVLGREDSYGTHLPMADLLLDMKHAGGARADYRRLLDLDEGIAHVEYSVNGVRFTREILASNPDNVLAMHLTAGQPGQLTFNIGLSGGDLPFKVHAKDRNTLVITGHAWEKKHSDGKTGVDFEGWLRVLNAGGTVSIQGDHLTVEAADAVTLLVTANTTYRGRDPEALCREQMEAAVSKSYQDLRKAHVSDHQRLFRRVDIDLGRTEAASRPTDQRLAEVRAGGHDPQLISLFFQYGRYLLIAGSRPNSPLPTNLQGVWNDNLACNMGWTCDFHLDINTQQNYWPSEVCNLSESSEPLFRMIESLRQPGRRTAHTVYGAQGWVCHVFTNAWGYTAPGWGLGWGIFPTGGIWLASHLWEHYQFTGDKQFLSDRAYPVLKEAAEFFLSYMVRHPKYGWLVTGPAVSPENTFLTSDGKGCSESMGPTCDRELVYDLFTSCIEASRTLGRDSEFREKVEGARAKLPPLRIGKHGQLQEWLEDFDEAVPNHRHTSHLVALYPSCQITPRTTPDLAKAAWVTIEHRISHPDWEDTEWSRANLVNFFARLGDGEAAHTHLLGLLCKDTDTGLLTFSRGGIAEAPENIFVIDGNSAGTAGIAEMLLQSHGGEIHLLPALPKAWPTGSVTGLRARGGFEMDIEWKDRELSGATLRSVNGTVCNLRYGEKVVQLNLKPGGTIRIAPDLSVGRKEQYSGVPLFPAREPRGDPVDQATSWGDGSKGCRNRLLRE